MSISFNAQNKTFCLQGKGYTYAFRVNENDYLEHLYFGKTIAGEDILHLNRYCVSGGMGASVPGNDQVPNGYMVYAPEVSFFGNGDFREPTVQVQNAAGDRLSDLLYESHEILEQKPPISGMPSLRQGQTLVVHLRDRFTDFCADLYYSVYKDCGILARRIVYKNAGKTPVALRRAYSFALSMPSNEYWVMSLHGTWGKERHIQKIPMQYGVVSVDSKYTSSSAILNPFVALLAPDTNENAGEAIGVNLVYSSSFVLKVQGTPDGKALVTGGVNDFDFAWQLQPGECFETPEAVIAYSSNGLGEMSRAFHDVYRKYLIQPRYVNQHRPIVINNWEATYFKFDTPKLKAIANGVAGTGVDTFVLDDGWFGKREDSRSGLGDWVVNTQKLNGGLKEIIDHVHGLGMKFGLWFEPEMVSEDSDLFRAHPDYAIGVPGRPRCYSRFQFVLDLTRKEVRDYVVNAVNTILKENEIDYVKWDSNRAVTESYSIGRHPLQQAEFAHRYALGVYDLFERIVEANPNVFFEGCSSGGARFDPGVLYYFPQIWTSDDSDAEERTKIQYGTSIVYPPSAMSCHVSAVPNHQVGRTTPMQTRAAIAQLGATGYELDVSDFTDEERAMVRDQVQNYLQDEDLILNGDLYRTDDPFTGSYFGFTLVSKNKKKAKVTAYRRLNETNMPIKFIYPAGLDENKRYYIQELDTTLSGSTIMHAGLLFANQKQDFVTVEYHLIAKE